MKMACSVRAAIPVGGFPLLTACAAVGALAAALVAIVWGSSASAQEHGPQKIRVLTSLGRPLQVTVAEARGVFARNGVAAGTENLREWPQTSACVYVPVYKKIPQPVIPKTMTELQLDEESARYMEKFWTDFLAGAFALGAGYSAPAVLGGAGAGGWLPAFAY